jgi:hypothetical protein
MKKYLLVFVLASLVSSGYSKDPEGKTFLLIFDKSELKQLQTSTDYIELSLMNLFTTKSFSGNSDAAIFVEVPYEGIDRCQLGDLLVRINQHRTASLNEIAFQIIDLDESKSTFQTLLASYEARHAKVKKPNKALKANPNP